MSTNLRLFFNGDPSWLSPPLLEVDEAAEDIFEEIYCKIIFMRIAQSEVRMVLEVKLYGGIGRVRDGTTCQG